jgi:serine/threonine-protein kinase
VGWVAGALGVVGLGVGSAFGVIAVSKKSDAQCDATGACNNWSSVGDAKNAATIANVGLIAGGALVATGAALLLFTHDGAGANEGRSASLVAAPVVGPAGGGVLLQGRW